jgi:hypothetical protein
MYRVEGFDIISDEVDQFSHDAFYPGRVASRIGRSQEHAVQAFVVGTHSQGLTRSPFRSRGVLHLEATFGVPASQIDHDCFDVREDPLEHYPVG